ncbi:MAG: CPBP family glutamic-type intramembrane protease [Bacteroidia bacterium]
MSFFQPIQEVCKKSPIAVLVLAFALFFIGQLFVQLAAVIWGLVIEGEAGAVQAALASPESMLASSEVIRFSHITSQIFSWGFAAIMGGFILGNVQQELGMSQRGPWYYWVLAPIAILLAAPVAQAMIISPEWQGFPGMESIIEAARSMEDRSQEAITGMLRLQGTGNFMLNVVAFAVAPAICEELFFRGLIQRNLLRGMSPLKAIFLTAFLFSLLHLALFGFFARLFLGFVLGLLAWRSKSIWPAILGHFTFNFLTVLSIHNGWDEQLTAFPFWIIALCGLGLAGLFFLIKDE